jgi:hypothetical protein
MDRKRGRDETEGASEPGREMLPRNCKIRYRNSLADRAWSLVIENAREAPGNCKRVCLGKGRFNNGNCGDSVFATEEIYDQQFICWYFGNWKDDQQHGETNVYVPSIKKTKIGHKERSAGPWINDSRDGLYNCAFGLTRNDELYIFAITDIAPGEELSIYYGEDFFGRESGWESLVTKVKCSSRVV